jgi:hypothetical protein
VSDVLLQFDTVVTDKTVGSFTPRVVGREGADGLWEGWIEFVPTAGGETLRTQRETQQPERQHVEYWAGGLTQTYLEGALQRALNPGTPDLRPHNVQASPAFDAPAPARSLHADGGRAMHTHAVLDPFEVYAQGEDVLRGQLGALDEIHLRNIVREHQLVGESEVELQAMRRAGLVDMIAAAVRKRAG